MTTFPFFKSISAKINEWTEPIIERVSAPFGIAFIIAFISHNWELLFTLFNFDPGTSLDSKILILKQFGSGFWPNIYEFIVIPFLKGLGALFVFYLGKSIALSLTTIYERYLRVIVFRGLDRGKLIEKAIYTQRLIDIRQLNEEAKAKDEEIESLVSQLKVKSDENAELGNKLIEISSQIDSSDSQPNVFPELYENEYKNLRDKVENGQWEFLEARVIDQKPVNLPINTAQRIAADLFETEQLIRKVFVDSPKNDRFKLELLHKGKQFFARYRSDRLKEAKSY